MNKLRIFALFCAISTASACTDTDGARRILEDSGYSNIEGTGYSFFSCSDDDQWRTGFTAQSPAGKQVSGTVCSGLMKGSTIRFD